MAYRQRRENCLHSSFNSAHILLLPATGSDTTCVHRDQDMTAGAQCHGWRHSHQRRVGTARARGEGWGTCALNKPHRCWAAPDQDVFPLPLIIFYFEVTLESRKSWGDSSRRPCGPFPQRPPVHLMMLWPSVLTELQTADAPFPRRLSGSRVPRGLRHLSPSSLLVWNSCPLSFSWWP